MEPIVTRVGQIIDGDNRFLGRSVFADWIHRVKSPTDALLLGLGVREIDERAREAVRLIALCLMSPDARVWPLKLTRLIASYGDHVAGYFGAQLATGGGVMGPGAGTHAARCLEWVSERVGLSPAVDDVKAALAAWRDVHPGPLAGFGVPFRPVDERRAAVLRFVGDGALAAGRHWRLHLLVVDALAPRPPNCVISFAALLLDIGVAADRVGLAMTALMQHVFIAHALEAAVTDGQRLHAWPPSQVDFRGVPARTIGDGQRAEIRQPLQRVALVSPCMPCDSTPAATSGPES